MARSIDRRSSGIVDHGDRISRTRVSLYELLRSGTARRCIFVALVLPAIMIAPIVSRADAAISFDMTVSAPPPPAEGHAQGPVEGNQLESPESRTTGSTAIQSETPADSRRREEMLRHLASRHSSARSGERAVGRLGMTAAATTIRAEQSPGGQPLVTIPAGTYVVLTADGDGCYGVLMSDRTTGWVAKSDVEVLQYEVVSENRGRSPAPPGGTPDLASPTLASGQRSILQIAYTYLGIPYHYGGQSTSGIDCSAFVQQCFSAVGIRLPRTAAEQSRHGMPVTYSELRAADRLYFASRGGRISHTGIYIGNGYFIHASSSRHKVAISRLSERLYARMYACARR